MSPASAGPPPHAKHAGVIGSQLDAPLAGTSPQPGTEAHWESGISAKRTLSTVEQQTQAIAKRKATREARNTLGKSQKVLANFHVQDFPREVLLEAVA